MITCPKKLYVKDVPHINELKAYRRSMMIVSLTHVVHSKPILLMGMIKVSAMIVNPLCVAKMKIPNADLTNVMIIQE